MEDAVLQRRDSDEGGEGGDRGRMMMMEAKDRGGWRSGRTVTKMMMRWRRMWTRRLKIDEQEQEQEQVQEEGGEQMEGQAEAKQKQDECVAQYEAEEEEKAAEKTETEEETGEG